MGTRRFDKLNRMFCRRLILDQSRGGLRARLGRYSERKSNTGDQDNQRPEYRGDPARLSALSLVNQRSIPF